MSAVGVAGSRNRSRTVAVNSAADSRRSCRGPGLLLVHAFALGRWDGGLGITGAAPDPVLPPPPIAPPLPGLLEPPFPCPLDPAPPGPMGAPPPAHPPAASNA